MNSLRVLGLLFKNWVDGMLDLMGKQAVRAEICSDIEYSFLLNCTKRAIFSDRMFNCHGHSPIISHSQGSENSYFPTHEESLY